MYVLMVAKMQLDRGRSKTHMYAVKAFMNEPTRLDLRKYLYEWVRSYGEGGLMTADQILDGGYYSSLEDAMYTYRIDQVEFAQEFKV